jgi:cytochrome c oxidase cbb3-type subunit 2
MRSRNPSLDGWQGTGLVAITYVYFLIYAQFGFLRRLAELGVAGGGLRLVMAAMALGGIGSSLLTPRLARWPAPAFRLRAGLGAACGAAALSLLPLGPLGCLAVALGIGAALGLLTVTLVTHLRIWTGTVQPLLRVGLGTGFGYLICNFPPLFTAAPRTQAVTAGAFCLAGIGISMGRAHPPQADGAPGPAGRSWPFLRSLACFTALVWLDSAAFLIIQASPELKAGTWSGPVHLWANGALHLAAALAGAWLLRRRGLPFALSAAFLALGGACLLLLDPFRAPLASVFYPVGVSLYSVALVAYPALLAPAASERERGRQAGWLYAIAGWSGSAMGIGMGQNLGQVPMAFVLGAATVFFLPWLLDRLRRRQREGALVATLLLAGFGLDHRFWPAQAPPPSPAERGRRVYIAEGCISCHSQYVRPGSADEPRWGPAIPLGNVRRERPPLIGDRRQGPDLAEVGRRRSVPWLRIHFLDPARVSGASSMPPYGHLFRDSRGEDLVAYLASLQGADLRQKLDQEARWQPSAAALAAADPEQGRRIFQRLCTSCHVPGGYTRGQTRFLPRPPDLSEGSYFLDFPPGEPVAKLAGRLAQIIKYGVPGSAMPGHESLSDQDIAGTSLWLARFLAQPVPSPQPLTQKRSSR